MNATFFFLSFLLSFTQLSQCHMVMKTPVPYGVSSLNNSPLDGSGSDFPCKQRSGVYDVTTMNQMAVGAPQILSFTGSAVHGGGSCQLSVTLDKQPTKDSNWKVIHSIIGGCPSGATGNLGSNDDATFQFSLPQGFPNGEATLAWTWFNKIGNREMYMNCAPITVTGGSDSRDTYNSLPNMFVANIGVTSCHTTEGKDVVFPDPGPSPATPASTPLVPETFASKCELGGAPAGPQPSQAPTYTQVPPGPGSTQPQIPYQTLSTMPMQMPPPSNAGPVVTQTVGSIVTETFGGPQGPFGTWVPAVPVTPFPGATQIWATIETLNMPLGADTTNRQMNPTGVNQPYPNAANRQFCVPALLRLLAQALISDGIVEARALDLNLISSGTTPSITGTPSPYVPYQPTATQPDVIPTQFGPSAPAASVSDGTAFVTATIPPNYPSAGQPNVITLTTVLSPTDGVPGHGPDTVITTTLSSTTSSEWHAKPSLSASQLPVSSQQMGNHHMLPVHQ